MSDHTDLRVFVTVVDQGGFTAAARTLGLSTSVVSRRVKALEDHLGVRLLERTTRRVRPTSVGADYRARIAPLLDGLDAAARAAQSLRTEPRGVLRLAAPAAFGRRYLAPVLADFIHAFHQVHVDAQYSDRTVDLLTEPVDLAIRGGASIDDNLVARKLVGFRGVCVASPAYLQRHGVPARPEDLRHHACLVNTGLRTMPGWTFEGTEAPVHVQVDGPFRCDDGAALVAAAEAGVGICYEPTFLAAPGLAAGRLVEVLEGVQTYRGAIYAVYADRTHLPVRVRLFIDHLRDAWDPPPWTRPPRATE